MHFRQEPQSKKRLPHFVCADCFLDWNLASVHFLYFYYLSANISEKSIEIFF